MTIKLKPGDHVYRVVELDQPDDRGIHTWEMLAMEIKTASDRRIELVKTYPNITGIRFEPSALGRIFFPTPGDALARFMVDQEQMIESCRRCTATAERALLWALARELAPHAG